MGELTSVLIKRILSLKAVVAALLKSELKISLVVNWNLGPSRGPA